MINSGSGKVNFGAKTDKGNVRELNEDCYNIIIGKPDIPVVFIIADGMGGHKSGEVASKTAVDYVSNQILNNSNIFKKENMILEDIKKLIVKANEKVYRRVSH